MLQDPSSLVATVFKHKYFSQVGMLEAKLGSGPSYAWRCLHGGLSLLKIGLLWRVEKGNSINIWTDRWIPILPTYQISSLRDVECWCEKVSDVFDPRLKLWREDLIQEIFSTQEFEAIKAIPNSLGGRADKLVWQLITIGQYIVKSCYHSRRKLESEIEGETSSSPKNKAMWKAMWKMRVAPTVKLFVWRACSEAFFILANL